MRTYEIKLVKRDNSARSTFWLHRKWHQSMKNIISEALEYARHASEIEPKGEWMVADMMEKTL